VPDHPVTIGTSPASPTAVIAAATSWEEFPQLWRELLAEVWTVLRAADGVAPGRNVMVYLDDVPHVEIGAEVDGSFAGNGRVVASSLPAGTTASTISRGAPSAEGLAAAHDAVVAWCRANGHELAGPRWEVYDHWRDDRDPAEFETEVHWLLRP
jgi:effector-binding domain-containing protein